MMVTMPDSMDECYYFTRRKLVMATGEEGNAVAWVKRVECPQCKKGMLGKPKDAKTGKTKIRSKEYECSACGYIISKEELEPTLICEIQYTCPMCKKTGETEVPYIRKTFMGAPSIIFFCQHCNAKLGITKKMKDFKKGKKKKAPVDVDE